MSVGVPHDFSHTAGDTAASSARMFGAGYRLLCIAALAGPVMGGCAMSFPMGSLLPNDEVTGSNSPVPFGRMLGEEDRRRELAALATALDPQGDGATVKWDNAKSGSRGAITATGKVYTTDSKVCRAFLSELEQNKTIRKLQGRACAESAGAWKVVDAKAGAN